MGEGRAACAILTSAWVTLWGGQSGDRGGGGQLGHGGKFVFFSDVAAPFFVEEMPMRGRNKVGQKTAMRLGAYATGA